MCPIKLNVQCAFRKIRNVRYTPLGKCCHARQAFLEKLFISALPFKKTHVQYALLEKNNHVRYALLEKLCPVYPGKNPTMPDLSRR